MAFFGDDPDGSRFLKSLATSDKFEATGGKSGATFSMTDDGRFVLKQINDKEMAMFLDSAPAYFEHMAKALFHGQPTILCQVSKPHIQPGIKGGINTKRRRSPFSRVSPP